MKSMDKDKKYSTEAISSNKKNISPTQRYEIAGDFTK